MRKALLITIVFLALVGLVVFISAYLLGERTSFFGKATSVNYDSISLNNSYLFASPLIAQAQDQEKIRVTIFILDDKGLGVIGKKVSLQTDPGINITEVQPVTDGYGKAIFDIFAFDPGEYLVEGIVESSKLPQKVKVTFN